MPRLILYQYDLSPFSEKIRLMLGYAGLPWHAVKVEGMPPRPELSILVGGYRKIPVAQIGAEVFCDSKTIATQIARLAGKPELAVENRPADVQEFIRKTELEFFLATFVLGGTGVLRTLLRENSLWTTLRFIKDRAGIGRKARIKPISGPQAKALIAEHLTAMDALLEKHAFLFGEQPCAADFSAYLALWTASTLCGKHWQDERPRLKAWSAHMRAMGHGTPQPISSEQALDIARDAEPAALAGLIEPRPVTIEPADYARDATPGLLIAESDHAWMLRREHPRVGTVQLHFPKSGYILKEEP